MKSLLCCLLAVFTLAIASAQPKEPQIGDVAPPLSASAWIQGDAVAGFQKGTVYVLEFWATWCGACHAYQPHIDSLAKKAGSKTVFVNITNEEKWLVNAFLSKKPMSTRVALDNKGATFKTYGVRVIPHTVIIGPDGRIAAITRPNEVTEEALAKVAAGGKIDLPIKSNKAADLEWDANIAGVKTGGAESMGHAILQRSDAAGGAIQFASNSGHIVGDGVVLDNMIQVAYGSEYENTKMNLENVDRGPFRVSVHAPDGKDETAKAMLKELLQRNFGFKAEWREIEKEMPVLRFDASKGNGKLKKSAANQVGGFARHGAIRYVKAKVEAIMAALGSYGFGQTVFDETGLQGDYDLEMQWNVADPAAFVNALKELGFSVTTEKRKTKVLVVDPK